MTTDTAPLDLQRAERDIRTELDRLEAATAALSLEALSGDPDALAELADLEEQLDDSKKSLGRLLAAQAEQERRNAQARADAAAEARADALTLARRLQAERETLARKVDETALALGKALNAWDKCTSAQEAALRKAGQDGNPARARAWQPACAVLFALREAGCPHGILSLLPPTATTVRRLVENDFRGLEPLLPQER